MEVNSDAIKSALCEKCKGSGYVSPRVSRGCAGDICFRCDGTGSVAISKPRKAAAPKAPKPSKRAILLGRVRSEVAENGKITAWALDAYVAGNGARISYAAFQQAAREGMKIYQARHG